MRKSLLACSLLLCPVVFAATPHWEYSGEAVTVHRDGVDSTNSSGNG